MLRNNSNYLLSVDEYFSGLSWDRKERNLNLELEREFILEKLFRFIFS